MLRRLEKLGGGGWSKEEFGGEGGRSLEELQGVFSRR